MTLHNLSHFMQPWLLPPGFNILILVIGFFYCFISRRKGMFITFLGIISLWLLSTPIIAYNLINLLQNKYAMLQPADLDKPPIQQAIVVLGGGDTVEAEYNNKHTVSDATLHRLQYAAYLYNKTHLPIVVSGGKSIAYPESEADLMANILRENYQITVALKEDQSTNTADEGRLLAPLLKKNHFDHVYLVTNAWHMPRSMAIFQHEKIQATPAPMGYYVYGPGYAFISLMPDIHALAASSVALHEYFGLLWFKMST